MDEYGLYEIRVGNLVKGKPKTYNKPTLNRAFFPNWPFFWREKSIQLSDYFMAVQYETSQFNYLYDHAWMVQLRHILLSDCHLVRWSKLGVSSSAFSTFNGS